MFKQSANNLTDPVAWTSFKMQNRARHHVRPVSLQRPLSHSTPQAVAGGGDGGLGGSSGGGGGGGSSGGGNGGSGDDSSGSSDKPEKPESGLLTGWRQRVAFDPEFPLKVLMEQVCGIRFARGNSFVVEGQENQSRSKAKNTQRKKQCPQITATSCLGVQQVVRILADWLLDAVTDIQQLRKYEVYSDRSLCVRRTWLDQTPILSSSII